MSDERGTYPDAATLQRLCEAMAQTAHKYLPEGDTCLILVVEYGPDTELRFTSTKDRAALILRCRELLASLERAAAQCSAPRLRLVE